MAPYDSEPPKPPDGDPPEKRRKRHSAGKGPRCPICGNPTASERKPFCSKRCAEVDLHRWLAGVYAVPTDETPDGDTGPDTHKTGE